VTQGGCKGGAPYGRTDRPTNQSQCCMRTAMIAASVQSQSSLRWIAIQSTSCRGCYQIMLPLHRRHSSLRPQHCCDIMIRYDTRFALENWQASCQF